MVQGIIETGRLIAEAKAALPHGDFIPMVEKMLPFKRITAFRLMAIASDHRLSNVSHAKHLPSSWDTLYAISRTYADLGVTIQRRLTASGERRVVQGVGSSWGSFREPRVPPPLRPRAPACFGASFGVKRGHSCLCLLPGSATGRTVNTRPKSRAKAETGTSLVPGRACDPLPDCLAMSSPFVKPRNVGVGGPANCQWMCPEQ